MWILDDVSDYDDILLVDEKKYVCYIIYTISNTS